METNASVRRFARSLELVGHTPIVPLRRLNPNPNVEIWAKLEGLNPGGSVKDRIALSMIEDAEKSGKLKPGMSILEATSGNTGIGLAMISASKGYKLQLTMSEGVSVERRKILSAYGAEFILTPAAKGTDGAIERAYDLADKEGDRYYLTDQYNNPANPLAHYQGTAPEIWEQTDGGLTHFVAAMGTTGTVMGCSRRLKEYNPKIEVVAVEPFLGHKIQGLKSLKEAYVPGIFDRKLVDQKVNVADEDAYETSRRLAKAEGLLLGMSSGAAVFAAFELARSLKQGLIVVILPDFGERYLSTSLFTVS
jgi:cysteinyl-tRNA synthetase